MKIVDNLATITVQILTQPYIIMYHSRSNDSLHYEDVSISLKWGEAAARNVLLPSNAV